MKITAQGNIITIESDIEFDELNSLGPIFCNEDGKPVYGASISEVPSITKVGVSFTYKNPDGMACLQIISDLVGEELAENFVKTHSNELALLNLYQFEVMAQLKLKRDQLEDLMSLVEIH